MNEPVVRLLPGLAVATATNLGYWAWLRLRHWLDVRRQRQRDLG